MNCRDKDGNDQATYNEQCENVAHIWLVRPEITWNESHGKHGEIAESTDDTHCRQFVTNREIVVHVSHDDNQPNVDQHDDTDETNENLWMNRKKQKKSETYGTDGEEKNNNNNSGTYPEIDTFLDVALFLAYGIEDVAHSPQKNLNENP